MRGRARSPDIISWILTNHINERLKSTRGWEIFQKPPSNVTANQEGGKCDLDKFPGSRAEPRLGLPWKHSPERR